MKCDISNEKRFLLKITDDSIAKKHLIDKLNNDYDSLWGYFFVD